MSRHFPQATESADTPFGQDNHTGISTGLLGANTDRRKTFP